MNDTVGEEEINRARWASRRGMLELDLVLEPFVSARYSTLSERDRLRYQQLMLCEDQQLYAWILRREQPEDLELQAIVRQVLEHTLAHSADK
ncbi:MAG: succinate dehydrogenase assembly factor 2 [Pseudomonadota bacterium]